MADRRVAVTGLGLVASAGVGVGPFWLALLAGHKGGRRIGLFDASNFPCGIGAHLEGFSARKFVPKSYRKAVKVMARDIELAVAAADLAFRDSGVVTRGLDGEPTVNNKRLGCNIGAGLICTDLDELGSAVTTAVVDGKFSLRAWGEGGIENLTPLWLLKYLPNMLACHVTIVHGAEGPSNCITCGDASGILSVAEAARWIRRDVADVVVAGGAESKVNPMGLLRQTLLKRTCVAHNDDPAEACRPFDTRHAGTIVGEGGGLLILEEARRARGRGARIYAEVVGSGAACDPGGIDVLRPTAGSLDLAVGKAIADAGLRPDQIDLIVACGTGVPAEDRRETQAWHDALGPAAGTIPAVSVTGSIGLLFAGTGGVLPAVAALALHHQVVPPTVNFDTADAGCELNLRNASRSAEMEYAVCGAFTVGGQSAACVLKRHEE